MLKLLHFSDAHIDIATQGKRDPQTGLPIRVLDFLKALDTIIDTAIQENVDLVIFSGDAYRDRTPVPTFQREWGKRIIRLSKNNIPTILLVGNHDISPAAGRATALQEFDTLSVPNIHVIGKPTLLKPNQINQLPVQVLALPWITRSGFLSANQDNDLDFNHLDSSIELIITKIIDGFIKELDPDIPTILTAHASVQGAVFGGERSIMLGQDMILPLSLVKRPEFDYVALGHIHKAQNLNEDFHPPVVYSGSIERVDFGEVKDDKYFVLAEIEKGITKISWKKLEGRIFIDTFIDLQKLDRKENETIPNPIEIKNYLLENMPDPSELENAITRLTLVYPKDWENLIDDQWIQDHYKYALEVHINRKPIISTRLRLGEDEMISDFPPEKLLELYWQSNKISEDEINELQKLAKEIIYNQITEEEI
jgi:exonuclease SbcD